MIGPNVIQAIIDSTGNNWKGFPFLFAMCAAASLIIWFGASRLCLITLTFVANGGSYGERCRRDDWAARCGGVGGEEKAVC